VFRVRHYATRTERWADIDYLRAGHSAETGRLRVGGPIIPRLLFSIAQVPAAPRAGNLYWANRPAKRRFLRRQPQLWTAATFSRPDTASTIRAAESADPEREPLANLFAV
jgi:hypothetical protein